MISRLPFALAVNPGNDQLLQKLRELENYDVGHINRSVMTKYGWSADKAKELEIETKKFFALAFLDQGHYHIPEPDVDEYWHRMILHSRFYVDFCESMFQGYYHHTPEPDDGALSIENRERSLKLIKYWFGTEWGSVVQTCTQCRGPVIYEALQPIPSALPNF
jgi:hypothetical protein